MPRANEPNDANNDRNGSARRTFVEAQKLNMIRTLAAVVGTADQEHDIAGGDVRVEVMKLRVFYCFRSPLALLEARLQRELADLIDPTSDVAADHVQIIADHRGGMPLERRRHIQRWQLQPSLRRWPISTDARPNDQS